MNFVFCFLFLKKAASNGDYQALVSQLQLFANQIKTLKIRHGMQIADIQTQYSKEIGEMKAQHSKEIEKLKQEHQKQFEAIDVELKNSELEMAEGECKKTKEELRQLKNAHEELKQTVDKTDQELKTWKKKFLSQNCTLCGEVMHPLCVEVCCSETDHTEVKTIRIA